MAVAVNGALCFGLGDSADTVDVVGAGDTYAIILGPSRTSVSSFGAGCPLPFCSEIGAWSLFAPGW